MQKKNCLDMVKQFLLPPSEILPIRAHQLVIYYLTNLSITVVIRGTCTLNIFYVCKCYMVLYSKVTDQYFSLYKHRLEVA